MRSILCLLLLTVAAGAGDSPVAEFDSIFSPLADSHSPGLAILVRRNGRTLFRRGYGIRDLRTRAAIDARTNFRLASFYQAVHRRFKVHDVQRVLGIRQDRGISPAAPR